MDISPGLSVRTGSRHNGCRPSRRSSREEAPPFDGAWLDGRPLGRDAALLSHALPRPIMLEEYKKFAVRGNVVDMAVGIIIGAAFNGVVQSLVKDLLTPPLGLLMGDVDFTNLFLVLREGTTPGPYPTLEAAQSAGAVTLNLGVFVNSAISFLIVSFAVFVLVRYVNRLREPETAPEPAAPTVKKCPYCVSDVPLSATRCPHCTSDLPEDVGVDAPEP